jgi:hypothetical protein
MSKPSVKESDQLGCEGQGVPNDQLIDWLAVILFYIFLCNLKPLLTPNFNIICFQF